MTMVVSWPLPKKQRLEPNRPSLVPRVGMPSFASPETFTEEAWVPPTGIKPLIESAPWFQSSSASPTTPAKPATCT
jgi:hypothetical protein